MFCRISGVWPHSAPSAREVSREDSALQGLGAGGKPRYVLKIVPERSAVIVGDDAETRGGGATLEGFRWLCEA